MNFQEEGFVPVATVGVDSGQLIISDPCYILPEKEDSLPNKQTDVPMTYDALLDFYNKTNYYEGTSKDNERRGIEPFGGGFGYVTETGWGDGLYVVYAKYQANGRVAQVLIDFAGSDDEDNEEEEEETCAECGEPGILVYNDYLCSYVCVSCDDANQEETEFCASCGAEVDEVMYNDWFDGYVCANCYTALEEERLQVESKEAAAETPADNE